MDCQQTFLACTILAQEFLLQTFHLLYFWNTKSSSVAGLPREVVDAPHISIGSQISVFVILYVFLAASAPAFAGHRTPKQAEVSV